MKEIFPTDPNRWFIARKTSLFTPGIDTVVVFGNAPFNTRVSTGQPVLETFYTEEELQSKINQMAGDDNYYENAVTTGDSRYNGVSEIYGPYDPPMPDPPVIEIEE